LSGDQFKSLSQLLHHINPCCSCPNLIQDAGGIEDLVGADANHMMPALQESTQLWLPWRISFAASNHCPCVSQDFNLTACKQGPAIRAASRVVSRYQLHGIHRFRNNSRPVVDCVKVELIRRDHCFKGQNPPSFLFLLGCNFQAICPHATS
jgi:hypothetical protein